mgnify:CR=1 FL=1
MTNILKKLLKRVDKKKPNSNPGESKSNRLLEKLQAIAAQEMTTGGGGSKEVRAKLALLVFPEIFQNYDGSHMSLDPKVAKEWATGLAQVIGFLVGICIDEHKHAQAIDDLAKLSKIDAFTVHRAHELLKGSSGIHTLSDLTKALSSEPPTPMSTLSAKAKQNESTNARQKIIYDLESQAMLEQMPEVKQALQAMADRMKKDIALDNAT